MRGQWREARDEWRRLGCPYEAAMSCMHGDDIEIREARHVLEDLDATRAVEAFARSAQEVHR